MSTQDAIVAQVKDLQNGEMKQVSVGDTDILLARVNDQFHAIGAYCTHYKAPLVEGVLSGDRVICPWHNACFNLVTGDLQEPPGLDAQPCYAVRIDGENVIASVPDSAPQQRTPTMVKYDPEVDRRTFVVLGAGAAGSAAVEALRQAGFAGRIVMVTYEDKLPYDRTWLSKDYFNGKVSRDEMPLRSQQFYDEHDIEVLLNKRVTHIDATTKTITFADDDTMTYDSLLLATGGKPRQLEVEGADLENIFTLRSFADTEKILQAAEKASCAVAIGSSFIGMEAAAGLAQKGLQVTVVSPSSVPFEKILGQEIGKLFQQVHEEQGVKFLLGTKAQKFEGNGKVEAVILENGDRLATDLVIVGVGVQPATEFLEGVELHEKDRSVIVDEYLCAADGLYAAGDIARYPDWRTGEPTRVEHWRLAAQHGRIAAYNMAGKAVKFAGVPVFWTMQFQFPLRYVGHATDWDEIIFDGSLPERKFIAFYVKDERVLAAAGSQRDTEMAAIYELMRLDRMPTATELRGGKIDLVGRIKS
ncbi:apoptosis inducing factor family protein [Chroococcidiopsis sp. TS-821]|uniref:apoptosis inducing factor family protein n=1 Tax=Chroococcidiopsis sp. TS-821 TaxID=1378066 RepID=UPI000CEE5EAB|nr:apoptosis inducing factor family protein [Chroococcidiopsis sp. TS-821]PPS39574.1 NAD(FAD)-dependent dehydrogenase [Chroococcidiopsis sp. TS-821]